MNDTNEVTPAGRKTWRNVARTLRRNLARNFAAQLAGNVADETCARLAVPV